ncbi:MAG: hypothetical protein WC495_04575 [Patescibacteria group bacterium]|jgi:hypothetical protein
MKLTQKQLILIIGITTLIIAGGLVGLALHYSQSTTDTAATNTEVAINTNTATNDNINTNAETNISTNVNSDINTNTATNADTSSQVQDKYNIYVQTETDKANNTTYNVVYKNDGIINSGAYEGYHRVIAGFNLDNRMEGGYEVLATQDYKTFVANTCTGNPAFDCHSNMDKEIVMSVGDIPLDFPDIIDVGNFKLVRGSYDFNATIDPNLEIQSTIDGYRFYSNPTDPWLMFSANNSPYFSATSNILVVDQNSIARNYTLLSDEAYDRQYPYDIYKIIDYSFYKEGDYTQSNNLYSSYGQLFPGQCGGGNRDYVLRDVTIADFVQVAVTKKGMKLYKLADSNDAIYAEEYKQKITQWKDDFESINKGAQLPTLEEYIKKNPVLAFQDPFGRWIGLGEWQYLTGGGCGKPVLYLYPQQPTLVHVEFQNPMRLTIDIPTYAHGWNVLANPDGTLEDLQPQKTDCDSVNTQHEGSEYAKSACETNQYPYLYWAGQSYNLYPEATTGWIVTRENLNAFLNEKLDEVGLNEKEKNDMMSFWIPEMLKKDVPYYRISFFQTVTMDSFIPMDITPTPDTYFRLFLDWNPLTDISGISIQPEKLQHFVRNGFTVVEWGGLKQ